MTRPSRLQEKLCPTSPALARLVGTGRAIELILTGQFLDAAEPHAIGPVTSVVPQQRLPDEVRGLAEKILAKGPLAVRLAKLVVCPE